MKMLGVIFGLVLGMNVCGAEEIDGLLFPEEKALAWEEGVIEKCDFEARYCDLQSGERLVLGERIALNNVLREGLAAGERIEFIREEGRLEQVRVEDQEVLPKSGESGWGAAISLLILGGVVGIWIRFYKRAGVV